MDAALLLVQVRDELPRETLQGLARGVSCGARPFRPKHAVLAAQMA
jgi:hypothetical protein